MDKIVDLALSRIGTDFTSDLKVDDTVSCAFATTSLVHEIDPRVPIIVGTYQWLDFMVKSPLFREIYTPKAGAIVVCATGTNMATKKQLMPHGHTGIYVSDTEICSNDSWTGLWLKNYTRLSWRAWFYYRGGYPVRLFEYLG